MMIDFLDCLKCELDISLKPILKDYVTIVSVTLKSQNTYSYQ